MDIPRKPGPHIAGLQPGYYAKSLDPRRDLCGWCIFMCSTCGRLMTIGKNHTIAEDGQVSPSLVCPHACTFHEFVRLLDW